MITPIYPIQVASNPSHLSALGGAPWGASGGKHQKLPAHHSKAGFQSLRREARVRLVQCLYAWHFQRGGNLGEISTQVLSMLEEDAKVQKEPLELLDQVYLGKALSLLGHSIEKIDRFLEPLLSRSIHKVSIIELCILRAAILEMSSYFSIPGKVVINEAVEVAKAFGASESFKFINGVLHQALSLMPISLETSN